MRPVERIDEITELINKIWHKIPDLRYMQLIYILQMEYSTKNGGIGKIEHLGNDNFTSTGYDLFNVEDTKLQKFLKQYLNELQSKST